MMVYFCNVESQRPPGFKVLIGLLFSYPEHSALQRFLRVVIVVVTWEMMISCSKTISPSNKLHNSNEWQNPNNM
jgi:hypothetical protein